MTDPHLITDDLAFLVERHAKDTASLKALRSLARRIGVCLEQQGDNPLPFRLLGSRIDIKLLTGRLKGKRSARK